MNPRQQEEAIERLLRQSQSRLSRPDPAEATAACLDAETIAAWTEGRLSGDALELAQAHAADCARCRMIATTAARLGDGVASRKVVAPRRWLNWLVPLSTAAAVFAVAIFLERYPAGDASSSETVRRPPSAPAEPQQAGGSADMLARVDPPAADPSAISAPGAPVAERAEAGAANRGTGLVDQVTSPAAATTAPVGRDAASSTLGALEARADTATAKAAAPPAAAAGRGGAAPAVAAPVPTGVQSAAGRVSQFAADTSAVEFTSPDQTVRWRIADRVVQRSTNRATTWETVSTGVSATLTAGSAPTPDVCWLVGRGGVVLVSTNGVVWRRVSFPEPLDLVAIQATDARSASVITSDSRIFYTADGGATWVRP